MNTHYKFISKSHQLKAKNDILHSENGLLKNNKAKYISTCGSGKTHVALEVNEEYIMEIQNLSKSISVYFFPSLALVSQTFLFHYGQTKHKDFSPLFICSDKKIADQDEDITLEEMRKSVKNFPVTTQPNEIKEYLKSNIKHKVIYCTYRSSDLLAVSLVDINITANFAVFDEAHNVALKNNSKISSQTVILHDKNFPNEHGKYFPCDKKLFMTATPKHFELKDENNNIISLEETRLAYSMDDERYFGKTAHEYSMREAIEEGVVADYQIIAITIDKDFIRRYRENNIYNKDTLIDEVKSFAILKAIEKYKINKTIAFHGSIENSKKFALRISAQCDTLNVEHIDGSMSHAKKEQKLNVLRNSKQALISNARLLSEGVDIPDVDLVALLGKHHSLRDIIQKIGRIQRIPPGLKKKKIGSIFIPILIEDESASNKEEFNRNNKELSSLYQIINSISEVDRQLEQYINYKIDYISEDEYIEIIEQINLLSKSNSPHSKKQTKALERKLRLYEQTRLLEPFIIESANMLYEKNSRENKTDFNEQPYCIKREDSSVNKFINATILKREDEYHKNAFLATKEYIEKFSYSSLNSKTVYKNIKIGGWRGSLRNKYKSLPREQLKELMMARYMALNENFLISDGEIKNYEYYDLLKEYVTNKDFGSLSKNTVYKEVKIGVWVNNIKVKYAKLEEGKQKEEIRKRFTLIDKDFFLPVIEVHFRDCFQAAKDYIKLYGYYEIKFKTVHNGMKIGLWRYSQQLIFYKIKDEKEKNSMLLVFKELHQDFLTDYKKDIELKYHSTIMEYLEDHSINDIKKDTIYKGLSLGHWRHKSRQKFGLLETKEEKAKMTEEFSEYGEEFLLDPYNLAKMKNIKLALEFKEEFGIEALTSKIKYKNFSLGGWTQNIKRKFNNLESKEEKKQWIEEYSVIDVNFFAKSTYNDTTQKNIDLLVEFKKEHGLSALRKNTVYKNTAIGLWVGRRRNKFNKLESKEEKKQWNEDYKIIDANFFKNENNTI